MIVIDNILRSVFRSKNDKLHILTMCKNDEKYIALLCQTQHNFYTLPNNPWNTLIEDRPSNIETLHTCAQPLDYIICYNRGEQYEETQKVARDLHVPIILVDMCSNHLVRPQNILETVVAKNPALLNKKPVFQICNNEHIQESWNKDSPSVVIPIGIDTNKFQSMKSNLDFIIAIDNNTHSQVGAHVGNFISKKYQIIPTDHANLKDISVNKSKYFINTNKAITIKTLEAMSSENIVICLKNEEAETLIKHNQNGILIESFDQLPKILEHLDNTETKRLAIAKTARETIVKNHMLSTFISKWNMVFQNLESVFYTPDM